VNNQFEQWLEKARALRSAANEAEVEFYLHLIEGEKMKEEWQATFLTFEALLKDTELADPARYTKFREAMKMVDVNIARRLGIEAVIGLAHIKSSDNRQKGIASMLQWSNDRGGVHPSRQTVERQIQCIEPVQREPLSLKRAMLQQREHEELVALRRRIKELETENARLKGELEKVRGKAKPMKKNVA